MKKYIFMIFIMIALISCKKDGGSGPKKEGSPSISYSDDKTTGSKYKVTFIELGSVRCVPCRMMQAVMKKVEEKYNDQVNIIFYDVWTEKDASRAGEFKIKVIPTQVFLDDEGAEYFRHEGYFPFEELEKILLMKGVE